MPAVQFRNIWKIYGDETVAVRDLSLDIADGEFMVFVGPSGCGKTSALRLVAGLEEITAGDLFIGDTRVNTQSPRDRNIAMVFQNYALYPHMTVRANIALGLKIAGVKKDERNARVERVAATLGLTELLERRPAKLSGGQRQRVAMGRAIVRDPTVFLLDEPLSNLDAKLRVQMRAEITELQRRLRTTTIFVTHDQVEAMTMADRVAVMRKGVLQQVGPPETVYRQPANLFVAEFIGSPAMNLMGGTLAGGDGRALVLRYGSDGQELSLGENPPPLLRDGAGRELIVGMRPEHLRLASAASSETVGGRVRLVEPLGAETIVYVSVDAPAVETAETREIQRDVDEVAVSDAAENRFALRIQGDEVPAVGELVHIAPNPTRFCFFDPSTGEAIA